MKELVIDKLGDNQRLDKYLSKYLSAASKSFIYKMLRKKNITLNNKKADGSEKLVMGDSVKIFFADETLEKFTEGKYKAGSESNGTSAANASKDSINRDEINAASDNNGQHIKNTKDNKNASYDYEAIYKPLDIVYENEDVLLINKPSGMLSQKSIPADVSLIEYLTAYMLHNGSISYDDLHIFHPGICNRLDRNTSGIVAAGKTMKGLQELSTHFKERTLNKYYICIVAGEVRKRQLVKGYLKKDHKSNKVTIYDKLPAAKTGTMAASKNNKSREDEYLPIETEYMPLVSNGELTLLKIHLITGRSHQIRAHLASLSHPLAGDYKYGDAAFNRYMKDRYRCSSQMLHSYELDIPDMDIHVHTDIPELFVNVLKGEDIWEPGIPEALEVLH